MGEAEEEQENNSNKREWDEMIPDALGIIFKKLDLEEILTVISRVCKSWGKAVQGPYCWQEIDIDEWSTVCQHPDHLDRMLRLLITRSCGSLRKLNVSRVNNDQLFVFIADHAGSLQSLILRRSEISNSIVQQEAGKFSTLTSLDLSYCCQIGSEALEAIGKNCKQLSSFCWNMHPLGVAYKASHVDEAQAIAKTMPKLRQLELAYLRIDDESVVNILSGCPLLESLDLRGCWDVHLDKKFLRDKHPKLVLLGPQVIMGVFERSSYFDDDYYSDSEFSDYDYMDYSDDDDDDESFDGIWDDDGLELRVYEGPDNIYDFGWPPSP